MKIEDLHVYFQVTDLVNLTTEISLVGNGTLKNGERFRMETLEYDDLSVALEVQESACNVGQLVSLKGNIVIKGKIHRFSGTGKIAKMTSLSGGGQKIVIKYYEYDKDIWESFVQLQRAEQEAVDMIFKAIKDKE